MSHVPGSPGRSGPCGSSPDLRQDKRGAECSRRQDGIVSMIENSTFHFPVVPEPTAESQSEVYIGPGSVSSRSSGQRKSSYKHHGQSRDYSVLFCHGVIAKEDILLSKLAYYSKGQ